MIFQAILLTMAFFQQENPDATPQSIGQAFQPVQAGQSLELAGFSVTVPPGFMMVKESDAHMLYPMIGVDMVMDCKGLFWLNDGGRLFGVLQASQGTAFKLEPEVDDDYMLGIFSQQHLFKGGGIQGRTELLRPLTIDREGRNVTFGVSYHYGEGGSEGVIKKMYFPENGGAVTLTLLGAGGAFEKNQEGVENLLNALTLDRQEETASIPDDQRLSYLRAFNVLTPGSVLENQSILEIFFSSLSVLHLLLLVVGIVLLVTAVKLMGAKKQQSS